MKGFQDIGEASNHPKRTSCTSQHDEFLIFFFFVGYFCIFPNSNSDPQTQLNPNPIQIQNTDFCHLKILLFVRAKSDQDPVRIKLTT
jgi:hypothetical protein